MVQVPESTGKIKNILLLTLFDKVLEDRHGVNTFCRVCNRTGHTLRMPLNRPHWKSFMLDCFDQFMTIGVGPCSCNETFSERVHALMMITVDQHGFTKHSAKCGIFFYLCIMIDTCCVIAAKLIRDMQLQFDEGFVTGEDWVFGSSFAANAREIWYCPTPAYLYYRDGSSSQSRLKKSTDTMLDNLIGLYQRKLRLIQAEFAQAEDAAALRSQAAAWITETLFNCTADLYLMKLRNPDRKTRIRQTCSHAKKQLAGVRRKTKLKSWILLHLPLAIYPIALLRKLYLKFK